MAFIKHIHFRLMQALWPVALITLLFYFGYHAVNGNYGLKALRQLDNQLETISLQASVTHTRRLALETKVARLRPDNSAQVSSFRRLLREPAASLLPLNCSRPNFRPDEILDVGPGKKLPPGRNLVDIHPCRAPHPQKGDGAAVNKPIATALATDSRTGTSGRPPAP